jgi:hypothetical protein
MTTELPTGPQAQPKRRGRPPSAPEDQRKVRALRLTDTRWHKLQQLGTEWLERAIDRAKV